MKKLIIGTLVAGIIMFFWQFLSWTALGLHDSQSSYTPNQDEILECLEGKLNEGSYFVPRTPSSATQEEMQALASEMEGKPWALIHYRTSYSTDMTSNLVRGFLINLIVAFLLGWLLLKFSSITMMEGLLSALAIGLIGYLNGKYGEGIWFEYNTMPDFIDTIVQWGFVGLWYGWWLSRP